MKHYNVHSDDSVDEDEVNCHGNGDDYDSKTTIKEAQKKGIGFIKHSSCQIIHLNCIPLHIWRIHSCSLSDKFQT